MSEKRELTRAEQVRARRAQQVRHAMAQPSSRVAKQLSPITARAGSGYLPARPKAVQNQRRFGIALGLPHIALRAPALNVRRAREGWRPLSFLLSALLGAGLYLMWTQPAFFVPGVTVFGNDRLTREEIEAVMGVNGQSIFVVQPSDLATRLRLNFPELDSVQVKAYLPNHVYVKVSERQPVIRWQQGDGFTWIDANGVAFRPRGELNGLVAVIGVVAPPADSPTPADALTPPAFLDQGLVQAILKLGPIVPAGSTLTYEAGQGLGWKDARGWIVVFGSDAHDLPLRISVYQALVSSLAQQGKSPEYINMMYAEAPYYRLYDTNGLDPASYGSKP